MESCLAYWMEGNHHMTSSVACFLPIYTQSRFWCIYLVHHMLSPLYDIWVRSDYLSDDMLLSHLYNMNWLRMFVKWLILWTASTAATHVSMNWMRIFVLNCFNYNTNKNNPWAHNFRGQGPFCLSSFNYLWFLSLNSSYYWLRKSDDCYWHDFENKITGQTNEIPYRINYYLYYFLLIILTVLGI